MGDTALPCGICTRKYPKSEMHYRKSDSYPYRDFYYYCTECNDKRNKRELLKATRAKVRKSPSRRYPF